jgi:acyl carrier protein
MPAESTISARIRAALAEHLKRDVDAVGLQDDLRKDLGLDSLTMLGLLFKIEEAFDLEVPNEDLPLLTTVADVVRYVEDKLGVTPAPAAAAPAAVRARPAGPAGGGARKGKARRK